METLPGRCRFKLVGNSSPKQHRTQENGLCQMGSNLGLTQLCLNGAFDYSVTSLIVHANQVYYPAIRVAIVFFDLVFFVFFLQKKRCYFLRWLFFVFYCFFFFFIQ